jgi:hypothetical protein
MTQVAEWLPRKWEALTSNLITNRNKTKERKYIPFDVQLYAF